MANWGNSMLYYNDCLRLMEILWWAQARQGQREGRLEQGEIVIIQDLYLEAVLLPVVVLRNLEFSFLAR
jgi:hypothetical protein